MFDRLMGEIQGRGTIIQIFYHGLDETTQAILDARGIFLYKTSNEAHQLPEDRVLLKLNLSKDMKAKPICKTVAFAESSNDSKLMEKMKALTTKIDSQFKDIKGEMKEMRDGVILRQNLGRSTLSDDVTSRPRRIAPASITQIQSKTYNQRLIYLTIQPPARIMRDVNAVFILRVGLEYDLRSTPNAYKTTTLQGAIVDDEVWFDPPPLKAYKPKIPYPQRLRKEKMEERYAKFIDLIKEVRVNVPLVDVLADMPNYGKLLKDLLPSKLGDPGSFLIPCTVAGSFEYLALADLGASINLMPYSLYASLSGNTLKPTRMMKNKELNLGVGDDRITFLIDKAMRRSHSNDDTCFRVDVIDEVTEEELDTLLDDSKPFSTTSEKINESLLDHEFKEFMATKIEEIPEQEEEVENSFEVLPLQGKQRIKNSIQEPLTDLVMKPLPEHMEYAFLEKDSILLVVISALLQDDEKKCLASVLKKHKEAFAWKTFDIPGISPSFCKHKINLEDDAKPVIQRQRRLNPNMKEVVKKEIMKLLDADQEKTTFTCPYGTYAYKRMPFGLCNVPATFQRCMIAIFQDMLETSMEVFMDNIFVFGESFDSCLSNLEQMLVRCKQAHLVLSWEKCHFMVTEGIVLGHKVSSARLEVDKEKIDVITKLLPPTNVKSVRSFLGHI
ncbi:reverse transcriptase domain-containing protein [Tanacetum coccineum]